MSASDASATTSMHPASDIRSTPTDIISNYKEETLMHTFTCKDCDAHSHRDWFGTATSDAEWHNTRTGHDVAVQSDDAGRHWELTEYGWESLAGTIAW